MIKSIELRKTARKYLEEMRILSVFDAIVLLRSSYNDGLSRNFPPKNRYKILIQYTNFIKGLEDKYGPSYLLYPNEEYDYLALAVILETMDV